MLANLRAEVILHDQIRAALCHSIRAHGLRATTAALQRHGLEPGVALALCGEAMQASLSRGKARASAPTLADEMLTEWIAEVSP